MPERYSQQESGPDGITGNGHERYGIDKFPGEETGSDLEDVVNKTQRGRNKLDGDPNSHHIIP